MTINIIFAITIFLSNRLIETKVSWIIVIFSLPLVGILLFILYGRTYRYRRYWKYYHKHYYFFDSFLQKSKIVLKDEYQNTWSLAFNLSNNYPYNLSKYWLFKDGIDKMIALFNDLNNAKEFIHVEYFILSDGIILDIFIDILCHKAEKNLDVRLIYDGVGSFFNLTNIYIKRLKKSGVKVKCYVPPFLNIIGTSINYRNHKKIVVIDGKIGYFGGLNIANEYASLTKKYGYWRDTHLKIKGESVNQLELNFLRDWSFLNEIPVSYYEKNPEEISKYLNHKVSKKSKNLIQIIDNSPLFEISNHDLLFNNLFLSAKKKIYIITPYLILSNSLEKSLIIAKKSNIDIKIITPEIPDKKIVHAITRMNYEKLIKNNIEIFEYQKSFIHSKFILIDDKIVFFGTSNLDYRSIFQNYETMSLIKSKSLNQKLLKIFLEDLKQSKKIEFKNHFNNKSFWNIFFLVKYTVLKIVSPLM
ncbi:cardiolipin synthase [symbiont of Argiope bruennichi]|uniref:cardiolipin synthase n=1 Tax=symbiont of Argiope bruennichi TaxID=2810479 RepID=UPI003DA36A74